MNPHDSTPIGMWPTVALPKSWPSAKPRGTSLKIQWFQNNLKLHLHSFIIFVFSVWTLLFLKLNPSKSTSLGHPPRPTVGIASQSRCCAAAKVSPVRSIVGGTPLAWPRTKNASCLWLIEARYLGICAWAMDIPSVFYLAASLRKSSRFQVELGPIIGIDRGFHTDRV